MAAAPTIEDAFVPAQSVRPMCAAFAHLHSHAARQCPRPVEVDVVAVHGYPQALPSAHWGEALGVLRAPALTAAQTIVVRPSLLREVTHFGCPIHVGGLSPGLSSHSLDPQRAYPACRARL